MLNVYKKVLEKYIVEKSKHEILFFATATINNKNSVDCIQIAQFMPARTHYNTISQTYSGLELLWNT